MTPRGFQRRKPIRRSRFTDEQIVGILHEGEAGRTVDELCLTHGINRQAYYRWKAKFGELKVDDARRRRELEDENRSLFTEVQPHTCYSLATTRSREKPHRQAATCADRRHPPSFRPRGDALWRGTRLLSPSEREPATTPGHSDA